MAVNVTGLKSLQAELEARYGTRRMIEISSNALLQGAEVIKKELEKNFESFRDTGASIDEITISEATDGPNGRRREIHWVGPKDRYRLIHINEWGTIKNPNPAGKGKVAASLDGGKKMYRQAIKKALEGNL
jgi:hypothetical protein